MKLRSSQTKKSVIFVLLFILTCGLSKLATAQSLEQMMQQNMMQQQMAEAQMNQHMANAQMQAEASLQQYIQQAGPALRQQHQQYVQSTGMQIPFDQYVRSLVMEEAARRNNVMNGGVNPMFEQQKKMFEAGQAAHHQRQQQYDTQNQNWNNQQRQNDSNHNRFIQQGIQGNQYYRNSETGQIAELPFAGSPGVYEDNNGGVWNSPEMGHFNQINPNGMPQQMEAYEPEYYGE